MHGSGGTLPVMGDLRGCRSPGGLFLCAAGSEIARRTSGIGLAEWHIACEIGCMEEVPVTKIEFFGGPEDGRVLDAEIFQEFAEAVAEEGAESIPMMVQDDAP